MGFGAGFDLGVGVGVAVGLGLAAGAGFGFGRGLGPDACTVGGEAAGRAAGGATTAARAADCGRCRVAATWPRETALLTGVLTAGLPERAGRCVGTTMIEG